MVHHSAWRGNHNVRPQSADGLVFFHCSPSAIAGHATAIGAKLFERVAGLYRQFTGGHKHNRLQLLHRCVQLRHQWQQISQRLSAASGTEQNQMPVTAILLHHLLLHGIQRINAQSAQIIFHFSLSLNFN